MTDGMKYEKTPTDKPLTVKQALKTRRESNIKKMTTVAILCHLIVKHRFPLVVFYATAVTTLLVIWY